ncbi:hypothetical protein VTL71DRAFT_9950 [Oculimacula yallundae]|uniref:Tat pathway signal sequence protein n=1 Tax=Oculimacula yallundae TaxID=86028 RepID=A0ABR4BTY4_9HELO
MEWMRSLWLKPSYKQLQSHEEQPNWEVCEKTHKGRKFSLGLTMLNALLTTVTITTVVWYEISPRQVLTNQQYEYSNPSIDPRYKNPNMNPDLKRVAGYSPLLDEVDLTPQSRVLNGAFHDNTTIFMQDPSPAVDKAWEFFSEDIFLTSWPTVRDSGRSLSKSIHFPPGPNGEAGKYIATYDVFHQIHCLNWLRKATNWEYYYVDEKPDAEYLMHQKHCIHMLLQSLMCSADVDMVTFEWMDGHDERVIDDEEKSDNGSGELHTRANQAAIPAANFNVHKMCRNFTALVEWAKKNKEVDPVQTRRKLVVPENVPLNRPEDY